MILRLLAFYSMEIFYINKQPFLRTKRTVNGVDRFNENEISFAEAQAIQRSANQSKIDNLLGQVEAFGLPKADIAKLHIAFKDELLEFVEYGTDTFKTAITNYNTPGDILTILDTVANPDNNFTIRDSIIYELNK